MDKRYETKHAEELTGNQLHLRAEREKHSLTREEVAQTLGISSRTLIRWEIEPESLSTRNYERALQAIEALSDKVDYGVNLRVVPLVDLAREITRRLEEADKAKRAFDSFM
ncbi:helix-turn-helix domain-containing protein [Nesterenkonia sp. CL21]|uniref:helix-turn-helix domain-containing protein n=1 Tax=Nesterenkonia sp. CL21 TaxID=3064894 RepID=UPI00287A6E37|nr:helix-turn-helix domain-containing protein [Nesterenkonia sp. CL21]MDS2171625.1 helix-turn-helix domain-containing protein [Nesterenkonia sp. CL21]